jgi:transcriptional regulator with XRE-family HTH domain
MRFSWKAFWEAFGHRLRVTRIALEISEQEAAKAFGVTLRTYRKYEAGGHQRGNGASDFAEAYDVSLDWLCHGEGDGLSAHLRKNVGRKVAILPLCSAKRRRQKAEFLREMANLDLPPGAA